MRGTGVVMLQFMAQVLTLNMYINMLVHMLQFTAVDMLQFVAPVLRV